MLIREFISETNKNQMISTLLKYYKVGSVKLKYKSMKDFAHFDVDRGELQLSTRYKTIKKRDIKEFIITIIHEIYHAMDAKKYGWKKFKEMYEMEMNLLIQQGKHQYDDNKYEIAAEKFGQKNWSKWYNKFKKEGLF
jgi:thiamine pyrophosphate-dependent acetolactate synthase large subunit-like protein